MNLLMMTCHRRMYLQIRAGIQTSERMYEIVIAIVCIKVVAVITSCLLFMLVIVYYLLTNCNLALCWIQISCIRLDHAL